LIAENIQAYGEDFEIVSAVNGSQAIDLLISYEPHLVLLDLRLPVLDGFTVLQAARRIDPQTPIIIVSAYGDKKTRERCQEEGAKDFFHKPFSFERLYSRMLDLTASRMVQGYQGQTLQLKGAQVEMLALTRRLHKLREQAALKGIDVPVHIVLEIEDIEARIAELQITHSGDK
jgi:DNA-binding response OmpR family regulator